MDRDRFRSDFIPIFCEIIKEILPMNFSPFRNKTPARPVYIHETHANDGSGFSLSLFPGRHPKA
jgi:hypothetical protein